MKKFDDHDDGQTHYVTNLIRRKLIPMPNGQPERSTVYVLALHDVGEQIVEDRIGGVNFSSGFAL